MPRRRTLLPLMLLLAACQTPAPAAREAFDDQVVVPAPPDEPTLPPSPEPEAEPTVPARESEPVRETFVPEPVVPGDLSFQETALARTVRQQQLGLVFSPIVDGGCGIPAAIRASADPSGAGYTVESCGRAVDAAHALTNTRIITKLGVLDASTVSLRHDGNPLWTAADDCSALRQNAEACASDFVVRRPMLKSFVGPILSYDMATHRAERGAKPTMRHEGVVIDVRTGQPARFGALIDEDSLLNALKRDSMMRRATDPVALDAAKTLDEVWGLWRTQDFAEFGGYYFAEWDPTSGQVMMRLLYLAVAAPDDENALQEIAVWVRPKAQWRAAFEDAAQGTSGFLAQ